MTEITSPAFAALTLRQKKFQRNMLVGLSLFNGNYFRKFIRRTTVRTANGVVTKFTPPAHCCLRLTFMSGSRDGEVVQLETAGSPPCISIGRVAPCELLITDDPDLSRRHARIFWNGSAWMLEDLGSSNGSFIGEFHTARRVSAPTVINDGEIFRVGLTRLRLPGVKDERVTAAAAAADATRY